MRSATCARTSEQESSRRGGDGCSHPAAERAVAAGARFLVMPHLASSSPGLPRVRPGSCRAPSPRRRSCPAWRAGAAAVKSVPASAVGRSSSGRCRGPLRRSRYSDERRSHGRGPRLRSFAGSGRVRIELADWSGEHGSCRRGQLNLARGARRPKTPGRQRLRPAR